MFLLLAVALAGLGTLQGAEAVSRPFVGITVIDRTESSPRPFSLHVVQVDLRAPGLSFKLTAPGGSMETVRQTTLAFLQQERAQLAINAHYFLPFPSESPDAVVIGLAASNGRVFSAFEAPTQSYALVTDVPALNLGPDNEATVVHRDPAFADGTHIKEKVSLGNVLSGSAQIVTDGVKTIPIYGDADHPAGQLTPGGPNDYSNRKSWYEQTNARSAIGVTQDGRTLVLLVADRARGSNGMTVGEVADILIKDYRVHQAFNLDGGGSASLAMEDPATHVGKLLNVSSDNPAGRSVASNLAIFATALPPTMAISPGAK